MDGWIVEMNSGWKMYVVVVVVLVYMQGIKLMVISGGDDDEVISRWIIRTSRSIWRRTGS